MTRKLVFLPIIALIAAAALLAACGGGNDDTTSPEQPFPPQGPQETSQILTIIDFAFQPATLSATAGRVMNVSLRNAGDTPHTFTIDGLVDSGNLVAGETKLVSFTTTTGGLYTFYCKVHGREAMSGTLSVDGVVPSVTPGAGITPAATASPGATVFVTPFGTGTPDDDDDGGNRGPGGGSGRN